MVISRRARSVRAHILGVVTLAGILPMALIGAWLTRGAVRSGRALLHDQLDASAASFAQSVSRHWSFRIGELLLLATNTSAQHALSGGVLSRADRDYLANLSSQLSGVVSSFSYRDRASRVRWTSPSRATSSDAPTDTRGATQASISWTHAVVDSAGRVLGRVEAHVALLPLIGDDSARLSIPGGRISVRDRAAASDLYPFGPIEGVRDSGEQVSRGVAWLASRRAISEPPLDIVVAAPLSSYVAPFQHAAATGAIALAVVAALALVLTTILTLRLTTPIEDLAAAAAAVSHGELDRRVRPAGPTELETLAESFNSMTDSLRRSMQELSRRSALAAVGEFAASLAHEVRNALTSVKVDLQRAEERLDLDTPQRELVSRSLGAVSNLNATVSGALRVARSGTVARSAVDIHGVLAAAAVQAAPTFLGKAATLSVDDDSLEPLVAWGDASALEQLFVNLFLNAAQALTTGGAVIATAARERTRIVITVVDNGAGIPPDHLARVFEPFFTTRPTGTGLGMPIARQIAIAHGGDIEIVSCVGVGTTATVRLAAADAVGSVSESPAPRPARG